MNGLGSIKVVAFDCFGTLVRTAVQGNVFADALASRKRTDLALRDVMRHPWTLAEAAQAFEADLAPEELAVFQKRLDAEIASVELFPDTLAALSALREQGYVVTVCSNLALPYAAAVERLLSPLLEKRTWSFEVGATKPSPAIYTALCDQVGCAPREVLMVGDSLHADYQGALDSGLLALHLTRAVASGAAHQIHTLTKVPALLAKC
jgi:HAD superfamily hydrolase (TIGR01549 family)